MMYQDSASSIELLFYKIAAENEWTKALEKMNAGQIEGVFSDALKWMKDGVASFSTAARDLQGADLDKETIKQVVNAGSNIGGLSSTGQINIKKIIKFANKYERMSDKQKDNFLKKASTIKILGLQKQNHIKNADLIDSAVNIFSKGVSAVQSGASGLAAGVKALGSKALGLLKPIWLTIKSLKSFAYVMASFANVIKDAGKIGLYWFQPLISSSYIYSKFEEVKNDPEKTGIAGFIAESGRVFYSTVVDAHFLVIRSQIAGAFFLISTLLIETVIGSVIAGIIGMGVDYVISIIQAWMSGKVSAGYRSVVDTIKNYINSKLGIATPAAAANQGAQQAGGSIAAGAGMLDIGDPSWLYSLTSDQTGYMAYPKSNPSSPRTDSSGKPRVFRDAAGLARVKGGKPVRANSSLDNLFVKRNIKQSPFGRD